MCFALFHSLLSGMIGLLLAHATALAAQTAL
jgi:hypothetical protein